MHHYQSDTSAEEVKELLQNSRDP